MIRLGSVFFLVVLAVFSAGCRDRDPAFPAPANILLITIDTLRADHLSVYGYERPTSPVLDRLAAEGARFAQPIVQWPKTGPSMASMFTATYPKDNGIVRRVGIPVPHQYRMLAEELRDHGYGTHAVVANGALASELSYDQGFDTYVEAWKLPGVPRRPSAGEVNAAVLDVAAKIDRDRPFFLWVHYIDPHHPYAAPGEWRDRFQGDEFYDGTEMLDYKPSRREMRGIGDAKILDRRLEHDFYIARYDAEIAYADYEIGRLLERWWEAPAFVPRFDAAEGEESGELDETTREQLKALGYLD